MTDLDAVALAVLGHPRRRLLGALVRHWLARPIPEVDDLPQRHPTEPLLAWACRCACGPGAAGELRTGETAGRRRCWPRAARTGQRVVVDRRSRLPAARSARSRTRRPSCGCAGGSRRCRPPRVVAVVGARAASRQGLEVAATIGAGLASAGVVVVSGLARGIDTAAHRAALDAGGRSVAVLGSGLDRIYPPEHARLADELAEARRRRQRVRARHARRWRFISRCATASSADWPPQPSSSRRPRRAARSSPRAPRSTRDAR